MENILFDLLSVFCVPAVAGTYEGTEKVYICYLYSIVPAHFGDNRPEYKKYNVYVHVFAPSGYSVEKLKRDITKTLFLHGFTYPSEFDVSSEQKYSDGSQHYVLDCEYAMPIDWSEQEGESEDDGEI